LSHGQAIDQFVSLLFRVGCRACHLAIPLAMVCCARYAVNSPSGIARFLSHLARILAGSNQVRSLPEW
jgi:hypothetical protein